MVLMESCGRHFLKAAMHQFFASGLAGRLEHQEDRLGIGEGDVKKKELLWKSYRGMFLPGPSPHLVVFDKRSELVVLDLLLGATAYRSKTNASGLLGKRIFWASGLHTFIGFLTGFDVFAGCKPTCLWIGLWWRATGCLSNEVRYLGSAIGLSCIRLSGTVQFLG